MPGVLFAHCFSFILPLPPRSSLFPYTTLFRSAARPHHDLLLVALVHHHRPLLELADSEDRRLRLIDDDRRGEEAADRKSTRLNSSHRTISYAVFCLKKQI